MCLFVSPLKMMFPPQYGTNMRLTVKSTALEFVTKLLHINLFYFHKLKVKTREYVTTTQKYILPSISRIS